MSEANRDEVLRCMDIAKKALAAGDAAKAQRFAAKAVNMGGADGAADLLQRAQEAVAAGGGEQAEGAPPPGAEPQTAEPATAAPAAPASGHAGSSRKTDLAEGGNDEQKQMVRRILKTGNYYDILGIPQGADEEAIKKAYKKTALKLHPDKCKAAGAEEAFKKVSRAFQCLSDAKKRSLYDKYGDEEKIPQSQNFRGDFVDANEIFAQFFGEAFNGGGGQAFGFPGGGGFTFHIGGSGFGPGMHAFHMGGGHPRQRIKKQAVKLTLEELREGVERHEDYNGTTFKLIIKPGTKAGKTFDFEENGVQFVVQEQKHERFDRKGDDVHHVATVPVAGFLFGCEYRLKLLTGKTKTVQFGPLPLTAVHIPGAGVSPEGRCIVRASPVAPDVLAQLRGWAKLLWWIVLLFFFMRNPALLFLFVLFRQFLPI